MKQQTIKKRTFHKVIEQKKIGGAWIGGVVYEGYNYDTAKYHFDRCNLGTVELWVGGLFFDAKVN